jgi:NitT/TauT family transport system ATP-binding protein
VPAPKVSAPKVLRIEAVGRRFAGGVEALREVSLDLDAGAFVALLGPSGCGKSTLLRLIAGLDQPDSGALRWQEGHAPGVGEIGFVFQDATLLPWASAADNVFLPLRLRGVPRARAAADIAAVLDRVGLTGFERARPAQLSGGMRMRVSIARALVTRPRLLLMDEPSMGLSPALVQQNFRIIKEVHESGVAVLMVEQNAAMALSIADRGYVLSTGEIVLSGSAADLLKSEDLKRAYLGA